MIIHPSIYPSIYLSILQSIYPSIHPFNHLFPYDPDGRTCPGPLVTENGFWDTFRTVYPLLSRPLGDHNAGMAQREVGDDDHDEEEEVRSRGLGVYLRTEVPDQQESRLGLSMTYIILYCI
jgi:hypothetical protein